MDNFYIFEKKTKFDNNEISVTDFTEQELSQINQIYRTEIEELQLRIKKKILDLAQKQS